MAEKGLPKLTEAEIESYLSSRNRSADSLLVAYRMFLDNSFLTEALEKYPDNPEVLLCALQLSGDPAKRLERLDAFKRNAPANGIGNCLAAGALLELGKDAEAEAEFRNSAGKPISDFTLNSCQAAEEAFLHAGYSPLEAKTAALYGSTKTTLLQMASPVWKGLDEMRRNYQVTGDDAGVQSLRNLQAGVGREIQKGGTVVDSLIGITYEKYSLNDLESPEATEYRNELEARKNALIEKSRKVEALLTSPAVPDSDWLLYLDRAKLFGERAANDWLLEKHPDL